MFLYLPALGRRKCGACRGGRRRGLRRPRTLISAALCGRNYRKLEYDTVKRTFATDGQTRVAIRDARRIRVLWVRDELGKEIEWTPRMP